MRALLANPVLARESRVRMRGWRAPALLMLYAGLLGLAVLLVLRLAREGGGVVFAPELGSIIFAFLGYTQFVLLIFSAPGLTASAISGERERQTLDLLLLTRMSPLQVVLGKLGAALSFTVLLMVGSLPVYSILFLLGGVSLYRLGLTVIVYVVTVLLLGSIGVYFSALFKRTQAAVVSAYGTTLGLILIPLILSLVSYGFFGRQPKGWTVILAYVNPLMGVSAAMGGVSGSIVQLYSRVLTTPEALEAIWWKFCLFALLTAALLVWLTARRIRPLKIQ